MVWCFRNVNPKNIFWRIETYDLISLQSLGIRIGKIKANKVSYRNYLRSAVFTNNLFKVITTFYFFMYVIELIIFQMGTWVHLVIKYVNDLIQYP